MLPTAALLVLAASAAARDNSSCDAFCGRQFRQTAEGGARVVGGQAARHGAWPWVVSLQYFTFHDNRRAHLLHQRVRGLPARQDRHLPGGQWRASHVQRQRGERLRGRGSHQLGGRLCPS
uniref:Acrosin n=1 Tax=Rousettus aegyptiacus TaxID=9407 RepID=A0A7J8JA97_ROUAE|nr:acrosin [Rousettus aegyptiacus]